MTEKKVLALCLGVTVIIIVAASVLLTFDSSKKPVMVASYTTADSEAPKATVSSTTADIGSMNVSDEKSTEFTVQNTGKKPLVLSQISSSCMCTFGQIIYDGKTSPEFGMHSEAAYRVSVEPGKSATVKIIYRPSLMPVYGAVEREVYVATNDPNNAKLVFKVTANVK